MKVWLSTKTHSSLTSVIMSKLDVLGQTCWHYRGPKKIRCAGPLVWGMDDMDDSYKYKQIHLGYDAEFDRRDQTVSAHVGLRRKIWLFKVHSRSSEITRIDRL